MKKPKRDPNSKWVNVTVSSSSGPKLRAMVADIQAAVPTDEWSRKVTVGGVVYRAVKELHERICGAAD